MSIPLPVVSHRNRDLGFKKGSLVLLILMGEEKFKPFLIGGSRDYTNPDVIAER